MQNQNPYIINDLARLYNLDYSSSSTCTNMHNDTQNYQPKFCLICNRPFSWTGPGTGEKPKEIHQNKLNLLRAFKVNILESGWPVEESNISEANFYATANVPFCENCSKEVGELEKLFSNLDKIVAQIDTIRNRLGNFLSTSYSSTIPDQFNYPVKKLIIQKLHQDFSTLNNDPSLPVPYVPPRESFQGHNIETSSRPIERLEFVEKNDSSALTESPISPEDNGCDNDDNGFSDEDRDVDEAPVGKVIDKNVENEPSILSNPEPIEDVDQYIDYLPSDEEIDVEAHKRMKRWPRKNTTCSVCNKTLCNASQLVVHMRTHTGEKPFKCEICEKGFISKFSLKCHTQTHSEEQDFPCPHCPRIFKKYVSRHAHVKHKHKNIPYIGRKEAAICEVCGDGFTGPISLQAHIDLVHIPVELFPCSICAKPCKKSALRKHERTHNPDTKRGRRCPDCPEIHRTHKSHPELLKHYAKQHPGLTAPGPRVRVPDELKNVKCDMEGCNVAFKTRRGLRHHYQKIHPGAVFPLIRVRRTGHEAGDSGKEKLKFFGPKVKRGKPFKIVTELDGNEVLQPDGEKRKRRSRHPRPEDRRCHICGKEFKSRHNLILHIRVHTGEKPYKCTYCDRRFAVKGNQQKHEVVHNEDRFKELRHECKLCDAKYALRGSLNGHIRRYHRKIPCLKKLYKCLQCPERRGFEKYKLRIHISRVHGEETKKKLEERRHAKEFQQLRLERRCSRLRALRDRGKLLKCPECPDYQKGFGSNYNLRRHISMIHTSKAKTKKYIELTYNKVQSGSSKRTLRKKLRNSRSSTPTSEDEFEDGPSTSTICQDSDIIVRRSSRHVNLVPSKIPREILPKTRTQLDAIPTKINRKILRKVQKTSQCQLIAPLDKTLIVCIPRCDEETIKTEDTGHSSTAPVPEPIRMKITVNEVRNLGTVENFFEDDEMDVKIFDEPDDEASILGI